MCLGGLRRFLTRLISLSKRILFHNIDIMLIVAPYYQIVSLLSEQIGVKGEVYPSTKDRFEKSYQIIDKPYDLQDNASDTDAASSLAFTSLIQLLTENLYPSLISL